jgi:hypothetical protein
MVSSVFYMRNSIPGNTGFEIRKAGIIPVSVLTYSFSQGDINLYTRLKIAMSLIVGKTFTRPAV